MCVINNISKTRALSFLLYFLLVACSSPTIQIKGAALELEKPSKPESWREQELDEWTAFAEAWLAELRGTSTDEYLDMSGQVVFMNFTAAPEQQWKFILITVPLAQTNKEFAAIAAGPMEHLLVRHGENYIELFEEQAAIDSKFARVLTGVWGDRRMGEEIRSRLKELNEQTTTPINTRSQNNAHAKRLQSEEMRLERLEEEKRRRAEKKSRNDRTITETEGYAKGLNAYHSGAYATALKEWKPLAETGDYRAQNNLGVMYFNGHGVTQDDKTALKWYKKAAEQGDALAQFNLGDMYRRGEGVSKDYKTAVKWYKKAAEQGYADAQINLGWANYKGLGVARNNTHALMWFNIAASQGSKNAMVRRKVVQDEMTPQDIKKAQQLTRECLARDYKVC